MCVFLSFSCPEPSRANYNLHPGSLPSEITQCWNCRSLRWYYHCTTATLIRRCYVICYPTLKSNSSCFWCVWHYSFSQSSPHKAHNIFHVSSMTQLSLALTQLWCELALYKYMLIWFIVVLTIVMMLTANDFKQKQQYCASGSCDKHWYLLAWSCFTLLVQHGRSVWGIHVVRTCSRSNSVKFWYPGDRDGERQRPCPCHRLD